MPPLPIGYSPENLCDFVRLRWHRCSAGAFQGFCPALLWRMEIMKEKPIRITAIRKEQTICIVENAVSDTAKETAAEKLKRLMLADAESLVKSKAS